MNVTLTVFLVLAIAAAGAAGMSLYLVALLGYLIWHCPDSAQRRFDSALALVCVGWSGLSTIVLARLLIVDQSRTVVDDEPWKILYLIALLTTAAGMQFLLRPVVERVAQLQSERNPRSERSRVSPLRADREQHHDPGLDQRGGNGSRSRHR